MSRRIARLAGIAVVVGCGHPSAPSSTEIATAPKQYTLTNLHPNARNRLLYTANFQQNGSIPRCAEVAMGEKYSREIAFTVTSTGVHYLLRLAPTQTPEGLDSSVAKYFGPSCDSQAVKHMSDIDQQGIAAGKALVGMTKQGVIYAIGYPPVPDTPSTTSDRWMYWYNSHSTFVVLFANGVVTSVQ